LDLRPFRARTRAACSGEAGVIGHLLLAAACGFLLALAMLP
jgi:hypothetical protein